MSERNFMQLLTDQLDDGNFLCIRLDADIAPVAFSYPLGHFLGADIAVRLFRYTFETGLVAAYVLDASRYPGKLGRLALKRIIEFVHDVAPAVPVILQGIVPATPGTAGSTASEAFDDLGADAVFLTAYSDVGLVEDFLERKDKGVIAVCKSSDPGSDFYQRPIVRVWVDSQGRSYLGPDGRKNARRESRPMYQHVAAHVATDWDRDRNCCLGMEAGHRGADLEVAMVRSAIGNTLPIMLMGPLGATSPLGPMVRAALNDQGWGALVALTLDEFIDDYGVGMEASVVAGVTELHEIVTELRPALVVSPSDSEASSTPTLLAAPAGKGGLG